MAREPTYPKDAPVAPTKGVAPAKGDATATPAPPARTAAGGDKPAESKRTKHLVTGAAIGIGSAAIVAALLYANRNRRDR